MKYPLLLMSVTHACVVFATEIRDTYKSYKDYKYYEVRGDRNGVDRLTKALMENDASLAYSSSRDVAEFAVAPSLVKLFMKIVAEENLTYKVLYDDISHIIRLEKSILRGKGDFSWTAYYDIDDIYGYLTNMSKTYPRWSELITGGQSYQGRPILGLRINTPGQENSSKPVVFIESGIHAREWIGPAATTYFIKELLTSTDPNITRIRDQFDWRVFPSCNPDGYHYSYTVVGHLRCVNLDVAVVLALSGPIGHPSYEKCAQAKWQHLKFAFLREMDTLVLLRIISDAISLDDMYIDKSQDRFWRKTLSKSSNGCIGADPNRNWDYNWGQHSSSDDPCDYQIYAGSQPFSEIETRSLSSYIKGTDNLLAYISFHSNAAVLLVPYSDSTEHVNNYSDLVRIGTVSLDYGEEKSKQERYGGPATAAEILYKASGGSMDWVRNALGVPLVYTFELRGTVFHWPASRIHEQGDEVTQMILGLLTEATKLGYC